MVVPPSPPRLYLSTNLSFAQSKPDLETPPKPGCGDFHPAICLPLKELQLCPDSRHYLCHSEFSSSKRASISCQEKGKG